MNSFRSGLRLFAVVAGAYALCSEMTDLWFNGQGPGATFFPAAGVVVAALVITPVCRWPVVIAAAVGAEVVMDLSHGIALTSSLGYALANIVEQTIAATIIVRLAGKPDISVPRDLAVFLLAAVAAPVVGATLGATTNSFGAAENDWIEFAVQWWIGDALGIIVIASPALALWRSAPSWPPTLHGAIAAAAAAVPVLLAVLLFTVDAPQLGLLTIAAYFTLPLLAGTTATALSGAGLALVTAQATASGHTFFDALGVEPENGLVYMQLIIAVLVVMALIVAAEIKQRERAIVGRLDAEHDSANEAARRRRDELLKRLAEETNVLDSEPEIAETIAARTAEAIGAASAVVCLVHPGTLRPRYIALRGDIGESEEAIARQVDSQSNLPLVAALRNQTTQVCKTRAAGAKVFRDFNQLPAAVTSVCVVPLSVDGESAGAIAWKWTDGRHLDDETVGLLEDIGLHYANALYRSRIIENQRRVAMQLQTAMQPRPATPPAGMDVAWRYLASDIGAEIGGDWFEFVDLGDGSVALAIGDVVGRGVEASAAMAQLRSAAAALAPVVRDPGLLLTELDRFATRNEAAQYSTALCAFLDTRSGRFRYSSAGHLPPLVVEPDGSRWLDDARSPLLTANRSGLRAVAETQLRDDSVLLFYTDGLVERRGEPIDRSLERLRGLAPAIRGVSVAQSVDRVISELRQLETEHDDDAAIIALRWAPAPAASSEPTELSLVGHEN